MKPGNDLADLRIVHDERQVHLRGPLRDEQDIDVANGVEHTGCDPGGGAQPLAHDAHDCPTWLHPNLAQPAQLGDDLG